MSVQELAPDALGRKRYSDWEWDTNLEFCGKYLERETGKCLLHDVVGMVTNLLEKRSSKNGCK